MATRGGYRTGRRDETDAQYDLQGLENHVTKAFRQAQELTRFAEDLTNGRTAENRAACRAKAKAILVDTIPYLQARIAEQTKEMAA